MSKFPKAREHNIVITESQNELLIYDLKTDRVYCLNETCRKVWELCDGETSIEEIGMSLNPQITDDNLRQIVSMALAQLDESQLLTERSSFQRGKGILSRRELMRVLGVSSAISLPLITTVIAPMAVEAQSQTCLPPNTPCPSAPGACCSAGSTCCGVLCCPPLFQCCVGFGCFVLAETCPVP